MPITSSAREIHEVGPRDTSVRPDQVPPQLGPASVKDTLTQTEEVLH